MSILNDNIAMARMATMAGSNKPLVQQLNEDNDVNNYKWSFDFEQINELNEEEFNDLVSELDEEEFQEFNDYYTMLDNKDTVSEISKELHARHQITRASRARQAQRSANHLQPRIDALNADRKDPKGTSKYQDMHNVKKKQNKFMDAAKTQSMKAKIWRNHPVDGKGLKKAGSPKQITHKEDWSFDFDRINQLDENEFTNLVADLNEAEFQEFVDYYNIIEENLYESYSSKESYKTY